MKDFEVSDLNFSDASVLVLGDLMLDRYYFGEVKRISPEAPVPVVKVKKIKETLGGAGNVINNLFHLNSFSCLIGVVGNDDNRRKLEKLLTGMNVDIHLFETNFPTTTKIRVIGEHQQVVRVDLEKEWEVEGEISGKIKRKIDEEIRRRNVVIISDYGKGVCTDDICRYFINAAKEHGVPSIVDPKGSNWEKYRGAVLVTPNVKELGEAAGRPVANEDETIETAAREIRTKYNIRHLIVTRAEKGMSLISEEETFHLPTEAKEVYDVSGAGDTVVSTLAVSIAVGKNFTDSMKLANKAAGIVVTKMGTAPIEYEELLNHGKGQNGKVLSVDLLLKKISSMRTGKKVSFMSIEKELDIFNKSFLLQLRKSKMAGDILVLGLKNEGPLSQMEDRAFKLSCLEFVDYVVPYDKDIFSKLKPDIIIE